MVLLNIVCSIRNCSVYASSYSIPYNWRTCRELFIRPAKTEGNCSDIFRSLTRKGIGWNKKERETEFDLHGEEVRSFLLRVSFLWKKYRKKYPTVLAFAELPWRRTILNSKQQFGARFLLFSAAVIYAGEVVYISVYAAIWSWVGAHVMLNRLKFSLTSKHTADKKKSYLRFLTVPWRP